MTTMGEEHSGGMVALIPRADDAEKLRVGGGEKLGELHLTLVYLGGDVTGWTADQRNHLTSMALRTALSAGAPVTARVIGPGLFNPDGHDGRDPCAVYLVGDSRMISPMREMLREFVSEEQHEPFLPHVTAGFGIPVNRLKYTGPVVFDRLRVAFAGDVYDFPLGEVGEKSIASEFKVIRPYEINRPGDLFTTADDVDDLFERKVMSSDPRAVKLREYWAHGKGRAQWNKWRELQRKLRKYVKNPNILDGLTSNIYRIAKGHNPSRGTKSLQDGEVLSVLEIKAAMALADPDADFEDLDLLSLDADEDLEDEEFDENDPDQVFERALIDDVNWEIDPEGALVRDEDDEDEPDDEEIPSGPRDVDPGPSLWDLA